MHEWALAEAIVDSSLKLLKKKNLEKVNEIFIKVGELQNIDIEVLDFAIKEISKGTSIENSKINYEIDDAILKCNNCGKSWYYKESFSKLSDEEKEAIHFIPETIHIFIHCPNCSSVDFDIEKGRGVYLEDLI